VTAGTGAGRVRRRTPRYTLACAAACALMAGRASRAAAQSAPPSDSAEADPVPVVRHNQVGYFARGPKVALVPDQLAGDGRFVVRLARGGAPVLAGRLGAPRRWDPSGELVRTADLSRLTVPGEYVLAIPPSAAATPVTVGGDGPRALARAALKAFYYQRTGVALPAAYAGPWARPAGHPDTLVLVHPSAAGPGRPAGTRVSAPGGWYDAGDYNKYVVNSGISTSTLLLLVEQFPAYAAALRTNVPESGNALPDALDEALGNVRWMLAMQDPADGGVYHKLTNPEFDAFVMPHAATRSGPRYVVQKSTAAALDLAAVAAHAARVARRYPRELPGLADTLARAAAGAWRWARQHPDSAYDQERLNRLHAPKINTGAYGDAASGDEVRWAAAELYLLAGGDSLLALAAPPNAPPAEVPSWASVGTLGLYALVDHRASLPARADTLALRRRLLALADTLVARARRSAYGVPMDSADFVWGSSAVAANQGVALVQAYRLTRDTAYLHAATAALDYVLGRNATGYSFVTGHGRVTPRFPHHRPSAADTVAAPVPGLLVGGPNPGRQDRCGGYPSRRPARAYVDSTCSYASNEIAINWNAPLAYLAAALDAIYSGAAGAPPGPAAPNGRPAARGARRALPPRPPEPWTAAPSSSTPPPAR